jgi:alkaline phosphatase D
MSILLDRRALLATAGFGLGGILLPGGALMAQALTAARGFTHNVASGEPGPDTVLLWTRFVPTNGDAARVKVEVSDTPAFTRIAAGGQMITGPWRDHTVKIAVDGLQPGRQYHYRFIGPDGSVSPVGRTKTLPVGAVSKFNIAIFSCSNMGFGYFNAYGHAARRADIDLVLHLGDYFYEYKRGGYDNPKFARVLEIQPDYEILTLADYRLRYASYRADPDLQALHQNFAVIPNTDDHEGANDCWEGGAQNHQPEEGDWNARRAAAMQAWHEWLPVGEQPWKTYDIGTLGSYMRTDSRMIARSRPWALQEILGGQDTAKALATFRDSVWQDPAATMFGTEQESWIAHNLKNSVRARQTWQVVGTGTVVGKSYMPAEAESWMGPDTPERSRSYTMNGIAAAKAGLPFNFDNWGGYPAARSRLLKSAQAAAANLVIVSGDSHNAWANDLIEGKRAAGVEFGGHSVSSPGYESATKVAPATVAKALVAASPELRWCDTSNRGYMHLSLTPGAATNEWVMMDTVATRSLAVKPGKKMKVLHGRKVLESA